MNTDEKERLKKILYSIALFIREFDFKQPSSLYDLIENLFDEPEKKEMTAKELVKHVGDMPCYGSGTSNLVEGMQRMYDIFKKEAGL